MDDVSKEYVDAQDEKTRMQIDLASERLNSSIVRLETKFDVIEKRINDISVELQSVPRLTSLIVTVAAVGITVLGLFLAIQSYASDRFDGGLSASAIVDNVVAQYEQQWQAVLKDQQARDAQFEQQRQADLKEQRARDAQFEQQRQADLEEQRARDARQDQKLDQIMATVEAIAKARE